MVTCISLGEERFIPGRDPRPYKVLFLPSIMASTYPVSDLDAEQLAHALVLALDSHSPSSER